MTGVLARRTLVVGLLATVLVAALDLSGAALPGRLRAAGAVVAGPVQRVIGGVDPGRTARLEQDNALLRAELARQQAALAESGALRSLVDSPSGAAVGRSGDLLPARVVGATTTASGAREITLDVGSRDGVAPDTTVVSSDGLVGRVVSVAPWSSDVRVLGGADATVGVRVGATRVIGSVSAAPVPQAPERARGQLSLVLSLPGTVRPGDVVTTLGSVGGRPYVPGIVVGRVVSVDPSHGQLTGTAVVAPVVDPSTLEVVGVLLGSPRDTPRAPAAMGSPLSQPVS